MTETRTQGASEKAATAERRWIIYKGPRGDYVDGPECEGVRVVALADVVEALRQIAETRSHPGSLRSAAKMIAREFGAPSDAALALTQPEEGRPSGEERNGGNDGEAPGEGVGPADDNQQ